MALVHLEDREGLIAPEGPVAPQGLVVLEAQIALEVPVVRARLSDQAHPDRKPLALPHDDRDDKTTSAHISLQRML